MTDETMDLILKIAKILLPILLLFAISMWFFGRDKLSSEEKKMLTLSYHQTKYFDRTEVSITDREQANIDSLQTCHFYGNWEYTKADGDEYLVTFNADKSLNYESKKARYDGSKHYKGSGNWRWLSGQFIWLVGKKKDNNPLLRPLLMNDNQLVDFVLLESDGRITKFKRVVGDEGGC